MTQISTSERFEPALMPHTAVSSCKESYERMRDPKELMDREGSGIPRVDLSDLPAKRQQVTQVFCVNCRLASEDALAMNWPMMLTRDKELPEAYR